MKKIVKNGTFNGFTLKESNPQPSGLFLGIILVISMILGCSTIKGDMLDEMERDQSSTHGADDLYNAAQIVQSVQHMTTCTAKTQGYLYYIIDLDEFQYCNGTEYVTINLTGSQGPAGADGTDGVDGADGTNGTNGTDGADGISIVWQGSLATAPADPQTNWAYYNTADGKSYLWNGDSWEILAQNGIDGVDGVDGADGTDGTDGQDWTDVTDTVVDNGDGTVTDYSRTLVWKKCSQGQVWNSANNDCTGTGTVDDQYGAGMYQYCDAEDNSCNGGTDKGILDGGGTSGIWNECDSLSTSGFAGRYNWRVPEINELIDFYENAYSNNTDLFPNTVLFFYWSSTSHDIYNARLVHFDDGSSLSEWKDVSGGTSVRCVSPGL